jgi:riboflavin synthase
VFTGIIEEIGVIQELNTSTRGGTISVAAKTIPASLKVGDSIAVNGVCLTSVRTSAGSFTCDISAETLRRTGFVNAKRGTKVNLERALMADGRMGGHFVLGHVDGIGRFISSNSSGEGKEISISFPQELDRYLVYKGSIAVDGISLTIASLEKEAFTVAIVPHTFESTNLQYLKAGDSVNLEVDILGKYLERFFQLGINKPENSKLTPEYLKDQGF